MPEFRIDDLNPEQLRAATAGEGPVLTIAGAGTGKTKTLAARVAWLVSQGIDPGRIMLLTFTRRASEEMLRQTGARSSCGSCPPPKGALHRSMPRWRSRWRLCSRTTVMMISHCCMISPPSRRVSWPRRSASCAQSRPPPAANKKARLTLACLSRHQDMHWRIRNANSFSCLSQNV